MCFYPLFFKLLLLLLYLYDNDGLFTQLKDLEDEWEKVGPGAQAKQSRFMRSQQDLREKMEAKAAAAAASAEGGLFDISSNFTPALWSEQKFVWYFC